MIALETPRIVQARAWSKSDKTLGMILLCLGYVALELIGGTSGTFALLMGAYVATVMFSVWCNGGLKSIFGLTVLFQACQAVLVSQIARVALGRNPESRLDAAVPTIVCEILVTLGYGLAGLVASRIRVNRGRPVFPPLTDLPTLKRLAIAGTILTLVRIVTVNFLGGASGPLHMLTAFDPLAAGAAIGYSVLQSGGRRLFNPLVFYVLGPIVVLSLASGSRGGLFNTAFTIVLAGWMFGYRFRFYQYLLALVGFLVMVFIVSPYSLVARVQNRTPDIVKNINTSIDIFEQVASDPMKYQYESKQEIDNTDPIFFLQDYYELKPGNAANLLNRFGLIRVQDMIISDVLKHGTTGFTNVTPAFGYLLPTILAPNKGYQIFGNGNALAHRVQGLVLEDDHTTGITLGVPPDAFSAFGWIGALLLPCAGFLIVIVVQKFMVSLDMTKNVFGIATALMFTYRISEGTLGQFIQAAFYDSVLLFVAYFIATQVSRLLDFHYLRPKETPGPLTEGETGVVL